MFGMSFFCATRYIYRSTPNGHAEKLILLPLDGQGLATENKFKFDKQPCDFTSDVTFVVFSGV